MNSSTRAPGSALAVLALVAAVMTMASCGTGDRASTGAPPTERPTASTAPENPAVVADEAVNLGHHRHLQVRCVGAGRPTVLLEVGGSGDMTDWSSTFVDALGAETTTCLYSRAGGVGSTPVSHQTRSQLVGDAYALLARLRRDHSVQGPYVFVGWSFGGSVALAEALEHPDRTAGLVILDTNFPADFVPACIASGHSASDCRASYAEDEAAKSVEKDIAARVRPLPQIPVTVVSALRQPDCYLAPGTSGVTAEIAGTDVSAPTCDALGVAIADKNRADWGRLGPQVTDVRLEADHDGLVEEASDELAALVLKIVTSAR